MKLRRNIEKRLKLAKQLKIRKLRIKSKKVEKLSGHFNQLGMQLNKY